MSAKTVRTSVIRDASSVNAANPFGVHGLTELQRTVRSDLTEAEALEADRLKAFEQGYSDGLAAAHDEVRNAMEESAKSVRRALAALCDAVDSFDNRQTIALGDVEDAIVAGAFQIAQAVLQRELTTAADPGAEALARAMQLVPERGDILARLHPEDVATLSLEAVATSSRTVNVVGDPLVERGGCLIEVGDTRVDSQLSSVLANVQTALFGVSGPTMTNEAAGSGSTSSRTTASGAPVA